jgi:hypothetical protein
MKPIVVNFFAGPGTGKSTTSAALFAHFKYEGYNVEYAQEYAKELVWLDKPLIQSEIFRGTAERLTIANKVEFLITDGPILQQLAYTDNPTLRQAIIDEHCKYKNINIHLKRNSERKYNPKGRTQTEAQAKVLDLEIKNLLVDQGVDYYEVEFSRDAVLEIAHIINGVYNREPSPV